MEISKAELAFKSLCNHPLLSQDFPIAKHILANSTKRMLSSPIEHKPHEPDLLEATVIFSKHIACIGCGFSLYALHMVPVVCCMSLIILLSYTQKELRQKKRLAQVVDDLQKTNTDFQETLKKTADRFQQEIEKLERLNRNSTSLVKKLFITLVTAKITQDHIQQLKKQEEELLQKHKLTQQEYESLLIKLKGVQELLHQEVEALRNERVQLTNEISRLSKV